METPLEISFTNMEPSAAVEARVLEKIDRLERIYGRITSCHVFIDAPHHHHRKGNRFEVRLEVRVPGTELAVNNKPGDVNAHEDIYVAIRDAFAAMERQLKKRKQQARGDVKMHEAPLQGRVEELHPDQDYGRIAATDGRFVYFHRNSVVNGDFDKLSMGDPVELVVREKESPDGPQASTVRLIGGLEFVDKPA